MKISIRFRELSLTSVIYILTSYALLWQKGQTYRQLSADNSADRLFSIINLKLLDSELALLRKMPGFFFELSNNTIAIF